MINRTQEEIIQSWGELGAPPPSVSIKCMTYNHENYIAQAIDGFLMQKTTFPVEILIHDDASTDKTASIVHEYEIKYPKIIKVIYEKENQYKIKKHHEKIDALIKGKYIALCEGDDYWTDPNKLQTQVDWLEAHPDYTMCCSDAIISSSKREYNWACYKKDTTIPVKDMILGGGSFIQTCTFVFRKELLDNYPECCTKCHVGDYPLQIWAVLKGKVRYFAQKTGSYRLNHPGSWTSKSKQIDYKKQTPGWRSEILMLQGLDQYSSYFYHSIFKKRQTQFILEKAVFSGSDLRTKQSIKEILCSFEDVKKDFSFVQRLDVLGAIKLPSKIYRIVRAFFSVASTLVWPSQQKIRLISIKIQEII